MKKIFKKILEKFGIKFCFICEKYLRFFKKKICLDKKDKYYVFLCPDCFKDLKEILNFSKNKGRKINKIKK